MTLSQFSHIYPLSFFLSCVHTFYWIHHSNLVEWEKVASPLQYTFVVGKIYNWWEANNLTFSIFKCQKHFILILVFSWYFSHYDRMVSYVINCERTHKEGDINICIPHQHTLPSTANSKTQNTRVVLLLFRAQQQTYVFLEGLTKAPRFIRYHAPSYSCACCAVYFHIFLVVCKNASQKKCTHCKMSRIHLPHHPHD